MIETSIIEFLKFYKINGKPDKKNVGVWVNKKKIAAIGLRVSRWITYHGCSINICNDLSQYSKILPCGLNNQNVTSILNEKKIAIKDVNKKLLEVFTKNIKKI